MDLCQSSYALGHITSARSSLSGAERALARKRRQDLTDADARALLAVRTALGVVEKAIHEIGSEVAAQQLSSRIAA
jgi:hypothetical protein